MARFQALLPLGWVPTKPPDIGTDLIIERFQGTEPTGRLIFLQHKARAFPKGLDGASVSVPIKTLHYLSIMPGPGAVIIESTTHRQFFYLPLQAFLEQKTGADGPGWMRRKSLTIPLAQAKPLRTEADFQGLETALDFDKRPGWPRVEGVGRAWEARVCGAVLQCLKAHSSVSLQAVRRAHRHAYGGGVSAAQVRATVQRLLGPVVRVRGSRVERRQLNPHAVATLLGVAGDAGVEYMKMVHVTPRFLEPAGRLLGLYLGQCRITSAAFDTVRGSSLDTYLHAVLFLASIKPDRLDTLAGVGVTREIVSSSIPGGRAVSHTFHFEDFQTAERLTQIGGRAPAWNEIVVAGQGFVVEVEDRDRRPRAGAIRVMEGKGAVANPRSVVIEAEKSRAVSATRVLVTLDQPDTPYLRYYVRARSNPTPGVQVFPDIRLNGKPFVIVGGQKERVSTNQATRTHRRYVDGYCLIETRELGDAEFEAVLAAEDPSRPPTGCDFFVVKAKRSPGASVTPDIQAALRTRYESVE